MFDFIQMRNLNLYVFGVLYTYNIFAKCYPYPHVVVDTFLAKMMCTIVYAVTEAECRFYRLTYNICVQFMNFHYVTTHIRYVYCKLSLASVRVFFDLIF